MSLTPIRTAGFATFELTQQEETQGRLLSPETRATIEQQATHLAQQLVTMKFGVTPEEREGQILTFVYLQAQREMLLELLTNCSIEFQRLADTE